MNDKELIEELRRAAKCEDERGGSPKTIGLLDEAAARLDYLRWHDIETEGQPPLDAGNYVLVIGEWDGVYEINTPIRCFSGAYEYRYWRRPANPVRRSFGSHRLESEEQQ